MVAAGTRSGGEDHGDPGALEPDGGVATVGPAHHVDVIAAGHRPRLGGSYDPPVRVTVAPDPVALAELVAAEIASHLAGPHGVWDVGLAGGETPRLAYRRTSTLPLPWGRVHGWTTDERHVPTDHGDSNAGMIRREWFDRVGATLHAVPHLTPDAAADAYEATLAAILPRGARGPEPTLVLLGLGDDGHTASLFAGTVGPTVMDRDVIAVEVPERGWRITATVPLLSRARHTCFVVSGPGKAAALAAVRDGVDLPATTVAAASRDVHWLVDRAAAAGL